MSSGCAKVLIVGETVEGRVHPTVHELVTATERVGGGGTVALCLPDDPRVERDVIAELSVDSILLMSHPQIVEDQGSGVFDVFTAAVTSVVTKERPHVVLFSKTDLGSVVAARVAARIGSNLASDCVDIAPLHGGNRLAVTRPLHGGSAFGVYEFSGTGAQIVSMRPGTLDPAGSNDGVAPRVTKVDLTDLGLANHRPRHVETVSEAGEGIPLEQAEIVVSGGRGLGGESAFDQIRELCAVLGAAMGASRAACDAGWIDHSHQVGLTGKSISPTTYITVGISGASQHMAGCSSARNIVAINSDREANIFAHSRFGVVGDWAKVLPAFTAALAELD